VKIETPSHLLASSGARRARHADIAYYGEPKELVVLYNQGTNTWSAPKRWPIEDGQLVPNAGTIIRNTDLDALRRIEPTGNDANATVHLTCSNDGLDRIANQIENHLLQLNAVAVAERQIVGYVQFDMDLFLGSLGTDQGQGFFEHAPYLDRTGVRTAATEKIPHMANDAAGVINFRDHGRQIAVGTIKIAVGGPQDVLRGSRERAGSRHRLVDLVRERRSHAAHQIEACGLRRLGFLFLEPCLSLADEAIRVLALTDDHAL